MSEGRERLLDTPDKGKIGKQIQLPLSKAIEISVKSLKVRFWRSMLTVSSIILAIAFLTFVWASSRMQSAVAVGMRPDVKKVTAVAQEVDALWKPFELELSRLFKDQKGDYAKQTGKLYAGNTGAFKQFCNDAATSAIEKKHVDFTKIETPLTPQEIDRAAERARQIDLKPDLEGWPTNWKEKKPVEKKPEGKQEPTKDKPEKKPDDKPKKAPAAPPAVQSDYKLKLAGVKGVVQAEVDRMGKLQLALQRRGVEPGASDEELREMSEETIWLIVISLLVCGVGITNAMLMSVTERFREIGTMKCLGALDGFIVKLFLLESTFQGVAGTVIGVAIGAIIMLLSSLFAFGMATFDYFPLVEVLLIVVYGLIIGSALSIVAAVFPALRAAHMAPVEAMRVEE